MNFRTGTGSRPGAKVLAAVLTLVMAFALVPLTGAAAYADDETDPGAGTEKIQVPDPLTYKTVIDGVDGEIPHSGQTLTKDEIYYMLVATGNTAADANYKMKATQLESLNEGRWVNMNLYSLDTFTFEADTKYRVHAYFQLDLSQYEFKTYGEVANGKRIHVKVNGEQLAEGNARYGTDVYNGKNNVSIDYEFTPKTTITSLDYTGFLEPAIGDSSWYRKMSKDIVDKNHSDIKGALDGRGMLYKYNENNFPEEIVSEESNPYTFQYGKYRVGFACVVFNDIYYIDETKPQNMTVIVNGVKTNVTGIRTGTPTSPYYVIECWRDLYLDQGPVNDFTLKAPGLIYNGEVQLPEVVVKSPLGRELDSSTYTVSTTDECTDVGSYSVNVEMKADSGYTGSKTLTFKIVPNSTTVSLKNTALTYNGKAQLPGVVVKDALGRVLDSSTYTVTASNGRKNVGTYSLKVKMKDDSGFTGEKTLNFKINPKGTTLKTPAGITKGFTAKWNKQSAKMATSRITGYQIRYSLNSSMSGAKTKTIKGYSKTSKKVTKLKAKKKYYVQVRTYKVVNGVKYYSNWSAKKSVKTK